MKWFYLFLGGGVGTVARYALGGAVYGWLGARFPFGTLAVNLLGCFLAGFLTALTDEKFLLSPEMRVLLLIGFLGGFTTFSSFMLETANLIKDGQAMAAFGNVALSVCIGFVVFRFGVLLAKII